MLLAYDDMRFAYDGHAYLMRFTYDDFFVR